MAPRRQAASAARAELAAAERAEAELNADVNEAIARTDGEVFTEAMGDEPIGETDDTSLEDMGEGLEGEEIDETEEEAPAEEEGEEPQPEQPPQPSIPPRVLRETRERYRENENILQQRIRDLEARLDNLSRQPPPQIVNAPQQPPLQSAKPDMFADQAGYEQWVADNAVRAAEARMQRYDQQRQMDMTSRLNEQLNHTATGRRGYEFNVAYRDLTSLDKTPDNARLVNRIINSPDPGQAILDWWEETSNPDYVEYHRDQIRQAYGVSYERGNGRRQQQPQQARHEFRLPRSLSSASGGRSQHMTDPEMFDDSEESVFNYGARR